jgi:uncharacterized protein YjiS (DUF1127 family)
MAFRSGARPLGLPQVSWPLRLLGRLHHAVAAPLRRARSAAREREEVQGLSPRELRDIGLDRYDFEVDRVRSFWLR